MFDVERVEHNVKELLWVLHDVTLFKKACPDAEQLFSHEVIFTVVFELVDSCCHYPLPNLTKKKLVFFVEICYAADSDHKINNTRVQIDVFYQLKHGLVVVVEESNHLRRPL